MFNFLILFNIVFILNTFLISAEISDKRLCANEDCTKIIGYGITQLPYANPTNDTRILSFKKNRPVTIYSKSAGTNQDLWGVVIDAKRGYAPKQTILEKSILAKGEYEVDTEKNAVSSKHESVKESVTPEPTKTFEVVDGTTINNSLYSTETSQESNNFVDSNNETPSLQPKLQQENSQQDATSVPLTLNNETKPINVGESNQNFQPTETGKDFVNQQLDNPNIIQTIVISDKTPSEILSDNKTDDPKDTIDQVTTNNEASMVKEPKNTQNEVAQGSIGNAERKEDDDEEEEGDGDDEEDGDDDDGIIEEEDEDYVNIPGDKIKAASLEIPPLKEDPKEISNETHNFDNNRQGEVAENDKPEYTNLEIEPANQDLQQNVEVLDTEEFKQEGSSSDVNTNETQIETSTVEPHQVEMPNPQDVHLGVVTDNPGEILQHLHNETETEETPQVDVNTVKSFNSGEINNEFDEISNSLLEKDNIPPPPTLSQINYEKLPVAGVSEQSYSHNEHGYASVNVLNESENQNRNEEGSTTHFEGLENSFDNPKDKEKISDEDITEEREKEIEQQIHDAEIQAAEHIENHKHDFNSLLSQPIDDELSCSADPLSDCKIHPQDLRAVYDGNNIFKLPNSAILTVLVIAAVTVVTFLWGYMYMEKRGRESNLIGKINNIQKDYLIAKKENEILKDKLEDVESEFTEKANTISNEMLLEIQEQLNTEKDTRANLELQIQNLEKELENSTEVGLELNRMLSEFLNSENGSETLVANVEQLQRQIIEQQETINTYNENLSMKETENHELRLEVDINNTKVTELQSELNKMALNLLKLEEDKEQSQSIYEGELEKVKLELELKKSAFAKEKNKFKEQLQDSKDKYEQVQKELEFKSNEYLLLKESISKIKKIENNGDALKSLLDVSAIQAQLLQLRKEKQLLMEQLQDERNKSGGFEIKCQSALQDLQNFKEKYDEADREKVEATTKLQVLDKYFKEREAHLQKELNKQESMWIEKQGEATSTIERIKYMQEELQNYKAQNESLKQEILEQEVQMKSQISVLEKKAHENWVSARQAERKLEDARQEAAQLRNRLTLRERSFTEEKMHNRVQSPLEQNGEIPVSPAHIPNDTAASPPLLYGTRENLTISPPLPGLPFLPPPPGVPFMPPPLGGVPLPPPGFMPPPPSLMPGDHRPPPLGRISSPPLNSRYSPDRAYSPYSRNTPSPMSDDDYDRMPQPPIYRGYNSYNRDDRREIHRPPPVRANIRNNKGGHSSGSANSNDSLDKINRHNSKV